jgi:sulfatase maturation enzyme AslB (radical SAM superfamily)
MKSDCFCIVPFVSLYRSHDSNVYPCPVMASYPEMELTTADNTLSGAWYSEKFVQFKKDMLEGRTNKICMQRCLQHVNSCRTYFGTELLPYVEKDIELFEQTGTQAFKLLSNDIFDTNKCNLKCIYCNADYSFLHSKDYVLKTAQHWDSFVTEFSSYYKDLKELWLASGESVLQSKYYYILNTLLANGKTDVHINFITNMTSLGTPSMYDLLAKFERVTVFVSVDGDKHVTEFLRQNSNYENIIKNLKVIMQYNKFKIILQPVMSNINILYFPKFHYQMVQLGLLKRDNVRYYVLNSPAHFNIKVLPEALKKKVLVEYEPYVKWLLEEENIDVSANNEHPVVKVQKMLQYMQTGELRPEWFGALHTFLMENNLINNFKEAFPELQELYYASKIHATKN